MSGVFTAIAGTAVVGAYSADRAGDRAEDAADQASAQTAATAADAEALNRERYEEAIELLTPYIEMEGISSDALYAQLGLPSPEQAAQTEQQSAQTEQFNAMEADNKRHIETLGNPDADNDAKKRAAKRLNQNLTDQSGLISGGYELTYEQLQNRQTGIQSLVDLGDYSSTAMYGEAVQERHNILQEELGTIPAQLETLAQQPPQQQPQVSQQGVIPGAPTGDPLEGLRQGTFTPSAAYEGSTYTPSNYMDYESEFLPEGPADDYLSTPGYMQSQDAIRQLGDEKRLSAAQTTGMDSGFYGGRRIAEASKIGGQEALALANLEQSSMQDYYRRVSDNQAARQRGAGMMGHLEQADLERGAAQEQFDIRTGRAIEAQDLGRQTAIEQADIMREEGRYAENRSSTQNAYTNYMNMLYSLSSPTSATNLAGMGMGNAATISNQNMAANQQSQNYMMQGVAAQNAAYADMFGGVTNMGAAWLGSQ